uniref:Uncharacterized protein n=1 Tax=mine drainage metagenome TaxID=410659 RepID=E6QI93_9ZZZZ
MEWGGIDRVGDGCNALFRKECKNERYKAHSKARN